MSKAKRARNLGGAAWRAMAALCADKELAAKCIANGTYADALRAGRSDEQARAAGLSSYKAALAGDFV